MSGKWAGRHSGIQTWFLFSILGLAIYYSICCVIHQHQLTPVSLFLQESYLYHIDKGTVFSQDYSYKSFVLAEFLVCFFRPAFLPSPSFFHSFFQYFSSVVFLSDRSVVKCVRSVFSHLGWTLVFMICYLSSSGLVAHSAFTELFHLSLPPQSAMNSSLSLSFLA